jgi:hypothetical protein
MPILPYGHAVHLPLGERFPRVDAAEVEDVVEGDFDCYMGNIRAVCDVEGRAYGNLSWIRPSLRREGRLSSRDLCGGVLGRTIKGEWVIFHGRFYLHAGCAEDLSIYE